MNKKKIIGSLGALLILTTITTGCGTVTLKNGEKATVTTDKGNISSDSLYKQLCDKYGIETLVNMVDHKLFDKEYKTDENETKAVDQQIQQMKSNYTDNEEGWISAIQQYFGVKDEDELRNMLSLEYKRNQAVKDYLEDNLTDGEIEAYYNENTIGDIKASHILIKADTTDKMSDDEKNEKYEEAKKEAEEVISKLNNGEDFAKLAKKYSDDSATAKNGGDLGYFNTDDNMDENFMDAAKKLEVGKYSTEPVKSQYGYHVILKVKEKSKPKLSKVKDDIKTTLAQEKLSSNSTLYYKTLDDVRKKNNVKFKDSSLNKQYDEYLTKQKEKATSNSNNSNS